MYSADKSGFKNVLLNFYKQIEESMQIFSKSKIKIKSDQVENILYLGMGGSAISGQILYDVLFDQLTVPLDIVQHYYVPHYCSDKSLVIVSSYSGNTEEVLHSAKLISGKKAQVVAITSGGELEKMAKDHKWPIIKIPEGYPPSQALGYLFFPIYHLLGKFGFIDKYKKDLSILITFAKEAARRNNVSGRQQHILSRELAQTIHKKIPVIYSTAPYLRTVSKRWQNRFTENSKSLAFSNVLPELNHNEIVGWELKSATLKNFIVILVENEDVHPRVKHRIELTKKIIKKKGIEVVDIYASGKTVLEKVFSLIIVGDWVSYYLALAYHRDPLEIDHIDFLKSEMAKL